MEPSFPRAENVSRLVSCTPQRSAPHAHPRASAEEPNAGEWVSCAWCTKSSRCHAFRHQNKMSSVPDWSRLPDWPSVYGVLPPRGRMSGATTCLLVVDVQPEFWSHCPDVSDDFPEFPTNCARTLEAARARGALVVFVRCGYRRGLSPFLEQFERLNPDKQVEIICEKDSMAWESFAEPAPNEPVLVKRSWNACSGTALIPFLRAAGIKCVCVMGLITSACVQHSAFGLFEAGFRVTLIPDACADRGRARHVAALGLFGNYMYEMLPLDRFERASAWEREVEVPTPRRSLPEGTKRLISSNNAVALAARLRRFPNEAPTATAGSDGTRPLFALNEMPTATGTPDGSCSEVALSEHVAANRKYWDSMASEWVPEGERAWSSDTPYWGVWSIADLGLLPADMTGMRCIELGCGTGYVSGWMARRGAEEVVGIDNSAEQLATAARLSAQHGVSSVLKLHHGNAEKVPWTDGYFDFAISEYGAAIWCDPALWLPEARRLLRPGGTLVFLGHTQLKVNMFDAIQRSYFDEGRLDWTDDAEDPGGMEFSLPTQGWLRLFRELGFEVVEYIELQVPEESEPRYGVPGKWAHQWPAEHVWKLRRT